MSDAPEHDLTTMEGRIAAACQWFDLTPPALRLSRKPPRSVMFTDEVQTWLGASGLSWAWVLSGDPKEALTTDRDARLRERTLSPVEQGFIETRRRLDEDERRLLDSIIHLILDGDLAAEDVVNAYKAGLAELRARRAEAAA